MFITPGHCPLPTAGALADVFSLPECAAPLKTFALNCNAGGPNMSATWLDRFDAIPPVLIHDGNPRPDQPPTFPIPQTARRMAIRVMPWVDLHHFRPLLLRDT